MVKKGWKGEKLKAERDWKTWTVSLAGHKAKCKEKLKRQKDDYVKELQKLKIKRAESA